MAKTMREAREEFEEIIDGINQDLSTDGVSLEYADKLWNWHISQLQREREKVLEEIKLWRPVFYRDKITDEDRERVIEEFAKIVDKSCDKDFETYDYKQIAEDFISEINSLRKK